MRNGLLLVACLVCLRAGAVPSEQCWREEGAAECASWNQRFARLQAEEAFQNSLIPGRAESFDYCGLRSIWIRDADHRHLLFLIVPSSQDERVLVVVGELGIADGRLSYFAIYRGGEFHQEVETIRGYEGSYLDF